MAVSEYDHRVQKEVERRSSSRSNCRFCGDALEHTVVDLGASPLCNEYRERAELNQMEPFYPLRVRVCDSCFLVQLDEYVEPDEIFEEYAYFSSYSDSWLEHAERYVEQMNDRLDLTDEDFVIEVASNDGYLLQYVVERGIPALGIEPATNVASHAQQEGIPTLNEFFGAELAEDLAEKGATADLIVANNVLAQVPDLNDFVQGLKIILKPEGVITLEFPHLHRLMEGNQFDTIYHEHYSYFSLFTTEQIFGAHGLKIFDVEELPTHGGSLRIYVGHESDPTKPVSNSVLELRERETAAGINTLERYADFEEKVKETKRKLLEFLIDARRSGATVVGYGAPGKGNTLLNYCGIRTDFIDFTVDRSPYKQGRYLPGTHIPIHAPQKIYEVKPDYVLILPWNLKDEIVDQMSHIREWGAKFVVPIPEVSVF